MRSRSWPSPSPSCPSTRRWRRCGRWWRPSATTGTAPTKICPLATWTEEDVEAYRKAAALPEHPLTRRGYGSIGCSPCMVAGEGRSGRWACSDKNECGLHYSA
ncbi:MAG: phosphoadenosine phosphosulfate reductase family protein [Armatimonadetes bacterium]|nr:phosphoadenosine phosphosulfate reductase family protein [Armatimonadota bacterium]